MKPNRTIIATLMCLPYVLSISILNAGETGEHAWQLLLANKPEPAAAEFSKPGKADPVSNLAALEGRYACARLEADFAAAWKIAREQAWISAPMENGLGQLFFARLQRLASGLRMQKELFEFAQSLLPEKKTHPAVRRMAMDLVHDRMLLKRQYDQAGRLEKDDGIIRLYAAVIGPLCSRTAFQLDTIEEPERNPGKDEYIDQSGRKVKVRTDIRTERDGRLNLYMKLPSCYLPVTAYAIALVESDRDRDIVLSVSGPRRLKIWLRGIPVYRGDAYRFEYGAASREVVLHLVKGVNPIMVKSSAESSYTLRLLTLQGGIAGGVKTVPYAREKLVPCKSMLGFVVSSRHVPAMLQALEKSNAPLTAKLLWLANAYENTRHIQKTRDIWDSFLKGSPKSLYLLTCAAKSRLRESRMGIDSKSRLTKEALDLIGRALKVDPKNYTALLLMGRHYMRNKQPDQALKRYKLAVQVRPKAPPAHYELARLYQQKGWAALAESEFRQLAASSPEWDLDLAGFYTKTGRKKEARKILDLAWDAGRIGWRRRFRLLKQLAHWEDAGRLLEEWYKHNPLEERHYLWNKQELARLSGDHKTLEACLKRQLELEPESFRQALKLAELFLAQGKTGDAVKWFKKADSMRAAQEDIDPELRRRIRKLQEQPWPLEKYDIDINTLGHQAVKKKDHPRANYAIILNLQVKRIYPDRGSESLTHTALKVLDKDGVGALSEMSVPQGSDKLLFCRTVQPDGSIFVPTSAENLQLGKAASMYNVKPGSVLEYAFRQSSSGGRTDSFTDEFEVEHFNIPVIRGRYVLIIPKSMKKQLSLKVTPRNLAPKVEEKGEDLVYTWDFKERKGLKPESFLPSDDPVLANISVEIRKLDFGGQQWSRNREAPIRTCKAIIDKAMKITGKETDDARRVQLIYSWIASNIKDAPGARTARDCFLLKSGDAGAKVRLCRAMLDALGIRSHFARVNSDFSRAGSGSRKSRAESASGFGGSLLHIIMPEARDIWLRFHRPARNYRMADIGYRLCGAPALQTDQGGMRLVTVRGEDDETAMDRDIFTALAEDGSAAVKATFVYHGSWAGYMRNIAEQPQRGPQYMERLAARYFPKITLDESDFPNGEEKPRQPLAIRSPFIFRFRGRVKRFCHAEGRDFSFAPFLRQSIGARRFIVPLPRENPYEIGRDYVVSHRFVFAAPKGWCFSQVPRDCYWSTRFGLYMVDFTVESNRLTASRFLILPTQKLTAEEYPALMRWLGEIEKTEKLAVSISKLPDDAEKNLTPVYYEGPMKIVNLADFQPRYWYDEK